MKAIKINTIGETETLRITKNSLETLQKAVDGYIEIIHLADGTKLVINEEGAIHRLPRNRVAPIILSAFGVELLPGDFIKGDLVIMGVGQEGEIAEIPAPSLAILATLGII